MMWLYDIRNNVFNYLIIWMMKHCLCSAHVFYTACQQYYPNSVRVMFKSWDESIKEKKGE